MIIEYLELLLESQVVILADKDVDISGPSKDFNPLAITSPMSFDELVTFSGQERAQAALSMYPEYPYALVVDTKWFLLGAYGTAGFVLNPGWPFGFELPPEGLQQMLVRFGVKKLTGQN